MENMFEKGCLVQLSASVWGASRKIRPEQLSDKAVPIQWINASKRLVNPDAIKPVSKVVNTARSYLAGVSLPFPIQAMLFVPKEMIIRVDDRLNCFKREFQQKVEGFLASYDELREVAMMCLGELFSELDYPVDIASKFAFNWRFVVLEVPNGNAGVLAPEVYEREKDKFVQTMEQARELAVHSLREEFASMVERITERFSNGLGAKPKVFKNATVNSFYEFFETFKQRNIFRDDQLAGLVEDAQAILGAESAEAIRSDDSLKKRISAGMEEVEEAMTDILSRPRRKIMMN
ncbi:DUF3150 domain-containing protein [Thermodesulfobacteriota bacterium]